MGPADLITQFGSLAEAARFLGLNRHTVNAWNRRGKIPYFQQIIIEDKTGGQLEADPPKQGASD